MIAFDGSSKVGNTSLVKESWVLAELPRRHLVGLSHIHYHAITKVGIQMVSPGLAPPRRPSVTAYTTS
jgi:hypothetical protein